MVDTLTIGCDDSSRTGIETTNLSVAQLNDRIQELEEDLRASLQEQEKLRRQIKDIEAIAAEDIEREGAQFQELLGEIDRITGNPEGAHIETQDPDFSFKIALHALARATSENERLAALNTETPHSDPRLLKKYQKLKANNRALYGAYQQLEIRIKEIKGELEQYIRALNTANGNIELASGTIDSLRKQVRNRNAIIAALSITLILTGTVAGVYHMTNKTNLTAPPTAPEPDKNTKPTTAPEDSAQQKDQAGTDVREQKHTTADQPANFPPCTTAPNGDLVPNYDAFRRELSNRYGDPGDTVTMKDGKICLPPRVSKTTEQDGVTTTKGHRTCLDIQAVCRASIEAK